MSSPNGRDQFRALVDSLAFIPDSEWQAVLPRLKTRTASKGDHLLRAGDQVKVFYFLVGGLLRYYYITEDGREFNKAFFREGQILGAYSGRGQGFICRFFVQALEDSELLVLPRALFEELYAKHPGWDRLGRIQAETVAMRKTTREAEFLLDSAETRYRRFVRESPELSQRLSLRHIASYLGITDVALSRIRRRMRTED